MGLVALLLSPDLGVIGRQPCCMNPSVGWTRGGLPRPIILPLRDWASRWALAAVHKVAMPVAIHGNWRQSEIIPKSSPEDLRAGDVVSSFCYRHIIVA